MQKEDVKNASCNVLMEEKKKKMAQLLENWLYQDFRRTTITKNPQNPEGTNIDQMYGLSLL